MLTTLGCNAIIVKAKKQQKTIKKAAGNGLYLLALPTGKAFWRFKYNFRNKEKLISFGAYPLISLSEAKEQHSTAYKLVQAGIDPSVLRQEAKRKADKEALETLEQVSRAWYQLNLPKWSPDHAKAVLLLLENGLFRLLGNIPVRELRRRQLLDALKEIYNGGGRETARRSRQFAYRILKYAHDEELVTENVAQGLEGSLETFKRTHHPSMSIDHLPEFLQKLDHAEIRQDAKDGIELLMLTMVRRAELAKAEWPEFNFDKAVWIIPAHRMKMRREHIVPLPHQAISILRRRQYENDHHGTYSKFVFPSMRNPNKPIDKAIFGHALNAMGYKGIHSPHGFRSLGMGIAKERLGYRHEVPDRQLAHLPANSVDQAYDHAPFLEQRTEMMQELANYVDLQRGKKTDCTTSKDVLQTIPAYSNGYYNIPMQPSYAVAFVGIS